MNAHRSVHMFAAVFKALQIVKKKRRKSGNPPSRDSQRPRRRTGRWNYAYDHPPGLKLGQLGQDEYKNKTDNAQITRRDLNCREV